MLANLKNNPFVLRLRQRVISFFQKATKYPLANIMYVEYNQVCEIISKRSLAQNPLSVLHLKDCVVVIQHIGCQKWVMKCLISLKYVFEILIFNFHCQNLLNFVQKKILSIEAIHNLCIPDKVWMNRKSQKDIFDK